MKTLIEQTDTPLTSHAGLLYAGQLLKKKEFRSAIAEVSTLTRKIGSITDTEIICSMIGLYTLGKTDYEDIEAYRSDKFFKAALGVRTVPSAPTLRQRIESLPEEITTVLREFNMGIIAGGFEEQTAEWKKDRPHEETTLINGVSYAIIDSDVTVLDNSDTKKEGVEWTYQKCAGYAPMISYIGRSGYMLNNELREGGMHSNGAGTKAYVEESVAMAREITSSPLLLVFDSGNDDRALIDVLDEEQTFYVIKRNLRKESQQEWLATAKERAAHIRKGRDGASVYYASIVRPLRSDAESKAVRIVVVARERLADATGQVLMLPEVSVETYWTNLSCAETEVESVYRRHGTSEQYHAELKSDLGVERLPSGKFYPNMLHMLFSMIAFNILRRIGTRILLKGKLPGKRGDRLRLRTVLLNVMYMAGMIITHAGRMIVRIHRGNAWAEAVYGYA